VAAHLLLRFSNDAMHHGFIPQFRYTCFRLEVSKIGMSQLIGYALDISFFKRDATLAPSVAGSAFLSMQIDICPQVVGKTNWKQFPYLI